jgi:hypothetical protein
MVSDGQHSQTSETQARKSVTQRRSWVHVPKETDQKSGETKPSRRRKIDPQGQCGVQGTRLPQVLYRGWTTTPPWRCSEFQGTLWQRMWCPLCHLSCCVQVNCIPQPPHPHSFRYRPHTVGGTEVPRPSLWNLSTVSQPLLPGLTQDPTGGEEGYGLDVCGTRVHRLGP